MLKNKMNNIVNFPMTNNQKIQEAINLFSHESADVALKLFIKLIDEGYDEVYAFIGAIYEFGGKNVNKDFDKARFYYEKSVERYGAVEAYLGLVRIYFYGLGVRKDYCQVLEYCRALVEDKDNMYANYFLGIMYINGSCVNSDTEKAREYFMRSWKKGYVFGLTKLALLERSLGNNFKSWFLRARAAFTAYTIAKKNINDPRIREIRNMMFKLNQKNTERRNQV